MDYILFLVGLGLILWALWLGDKQARLHPEKVSSGCLAEGILVLGGLAFMAAAVFFAGEMSGL